MVLYNIMMMMTLGIINAHEVEDTFPASAFAFGVWHKLFKFICGNSANIFSLKHLSSARDALIFRASMILLACLIRTWKKVYRGWLRS